MKLLFLLLFLSLRGNDPSDYGIPYRTLSFKDFRGKVPSGESAVAARTGTQMVLEFTESGGVFTYVVTAYFQPDSSFMRLRTREVLLHEQTHFQIAHIMALRCSQALAPLQKGDASTQAASEKVFNQYVAERNAMNAQFDGETNHGLILETEWDWELKIDRDLRQLQKAAPRKAK